MMLEIKRDSFELEKAKLLKNGGVHSETKLTVVGDNSTEVITRKEDTPRVPHPDLEDPIRNLKERLLISCGFINMRTIVIAKEFKATKEQIKAVEKYLSILMNKTTVTGIHVSGKDKNRGVIISGVITAENSRNIAINSPRMTFSSHVFGFEEDLEAAVEEIQNETYAYLFQGKKAQLDAFSQDQQQGKDEKKDSKKKEEGKKD